MLKIDNDAWSTRRKVHYGLVPLLLSGSACVLNDTRSPSDEPSTSSHNRITVSGRLTDEGAECQALRGDDGQLYTLLGDLKGVTMGARVCVSGERLEVSACQQGITIRVAAILPTDRCP